MLISDSIEQHAHLHAHKIAIHCGGEAWSYQYLHKHICSIQRVLPSDTKQRPKLAYLLSNRPECLALFLAAAKEGWIVVPLDQHWNVSYMRQVLAQVQPTIFVCERQWMDKVEPLSEGTQVIVLHEDKMELSQDQPYMLNYQSWLRSNIIDNIDSDRDNHYKRKSTTEHDLFYMGFTSGTTSEPKRYVRTHKSWLESFKACTQGFELVEEDEVLIMGSLVHSLFLFAAIHTLYLGGSCYLLKKFQAEQSIHAIHKHDITVVYVVPTMVQDLLHLQNRPIIQQPNTLSKLICAGAKWSLQSKQDVASLWPQIELIEFFGASELSFVSFLRNAQELHEEKCIGMPFHGVQVSIRDASGQVAERGQSGRLFVKSDMLFAGYLGSEETQIVSNDQHGWLTVGDRAWQDERGYLFLLGREDMINHGGWNVYPQEIEDVLNQVAEINSVLVYGRKNSFWGQVIVALVLLKEDLPTNQEHLIRKQVRQHCKTHLAKYKQPRYVLFYDSFEYTSGGKIARRVMIDLAEQRITSERGKAVE